MDCLICPMCTTAARRFKRQTYMMRHLETRHGLSRIQALHVWFELHTIKEL